VLSTIENAKVVAFVRRKVAVGLIANAMANVFAQRRERNEKTLS